MHNRIEGYLNIKAKYARSLRLDTLKYMKK